MANTLPLACKVLIADVQAIVDKASILAEAGGEQPFVYEGFVVAQLLGTIAKQGVPIDVNLSPDEEKTRRALLAAKKAFDEAISGGVVAATPADVARLRVVKG